jgi:hypothetical protein
MKVLSFSMAPAWAEAGIKNSIKAAKIYFIISQSRMA